MSKEHSEGSPRFKASRQKIAHLLRCITWVIRVLGFELAYTHLNLAKKENKTRRMKPTLKEKEKKVHHVIAVADLQFGLHLWHIRIISINLRSSRNSCVKGMYLNKTINDRWITQNGKCTGFLVT
jgi:hypothetical protein